MALARSSAQYSPRAGLAWLCAGACTPSRHFAAGSRTAVLVPRNSMSPFSGCGRNGESAASDIYRPCLFACVGMYSGITQHPPPPTSSAEGLLSSTVFIGRQYITKKSCWPAKGKKGKKSRKHGRGKRGFGVVDTGSGRSVGTGLSVLHTE